MTPAERWDRALAILAAIGGSAVVRQYKSGGCSVDVYFRNRVEGCLGRVKAKSKPGLVGREALDPVTNECADKIERQAALVLADLRRLSDRPRSGGNGE